MIHNMPADKKDLQIFTFDRDNGLLRCSGARQSGTIRLARVTLKKAVEGINIYSHLPEMVMTLSGTVYNENLHPYKNGRVVVYRTDNNCVYDTIVGDDGKFCLAVDDFPEGTEFFVQYITKNEKLVKADIHFDDYTYPAVDKRERWTYASIYGESDKTVGLHSSLDNLYLPEITVKARARTDRSHETEKFYSTGYKDRETIEEKNYFTLLDILRDIPQVVVKHTDSGYCLLSTRGGATLKKSESGKLKNSFGEFDESLNMPMADDITAVSMPLIVDGSRYSGSQFDNAMNISAFEIESVEYLRPWQTLAVTFGAMQGAVVVTTRKYKGERTVPSRGTYYRPQGLSEVFGGGKHLYAPSSPGRYRVIIDAMDDGVVRSYNRVVQVN